MNTNPFVNLATTMLALSVALERIVEILKGWFSNSFLFATQSDTKSEMKRVAWLHVFSGALGAVVAWVSHTNVLDGMWKGPDDPPLALQCTIAGLLASGGSAFWNHILDILKATKVQSEQGAVDAVAANTQKNLLDFTQPGSLTVATRRLASTAPVAQNKTQTSQPCGASVNSLGDWIATAGTVLNFDLKNSVGAQVNLVIANCGVTVTNANGVNQKVDSTITLNSISFTAKDAGVYTLTVAPQGPNDATAELVERCTGRTFLIVRATDPIQQKTIHVTQPA